MAVSRINEAGLNVNQYGNRRLNLNGAMQVAQRASSAATSDGTEGYKTLDRWRILYSSSAGGAATMSQDTTVPNTSFANSLKLDVTTADTSISDNHAITLQYRFEAQDIANSGWDYTNSDSNMSVSFWARSVKAGTYCVFFFTQDGTSKGLVQEYTLEANTWKYVTLRFKGDSGISFNDDNNNGLTVGWTFVAGANRYDGVTAGTWVTTNSGSAQGRYATSNQVNFFDSTSNDFYLTGVQIEVGDTATDFEHRTFADELMRCKRYFQRVGDASNTQRVCDTFGWTTGIVLPLFLWPVEMRAAPTFSTTDVTGGRIEGDVAVNSTNITSNVLSKQGGTLNVATSGLTEDNPYMFSMAAGTFLQLDAEL